MEIIRRAKRIFDSRGSCREESEDNFKILGILTFPANFPKEEKKVFQLYCRSIAILTVVRGFRREIEDNFEFLGNLKFPANFPNFLEENIIFQLSWRFIAVLTIVRGCR